ncbi:hypothetical protein C0V70_01795 [Bacteriovorax stolpii]|uniref:Uncharacterized protein n=1 Tax=Bacteriovorax stolpii TaxID=960 RepID=A0A2K9NMX1_BACTC|nr:hypothetical protein [Bacteriovorax stolpii]AUN96857.1 hypothetical protein C0V70_01795 [Bacteriovorax stolpii]TDP53135.1 hypothetical protein C8D79_1776 [Bacteriovorax stolpii]
MLLIKKIILAVVAVIALYSAETNAATISANQCTLGLLPFGSSMNENTRKEEIIKAYEQKGYFVTVLSHPSEVSSVEFVSDASVECTSTYFGIMAKTSVRLVETSTNKIISTTSSPAVMELFNCKIDLGSAISALPDCRIK